MPGLKWALFTAGERGKAQSSRHRNNRRAIKTKLNNRTSKRGMQADYVRNLAKNPRVRLKLRHGILACWHSGTANVLPHDDPRERQRWLAQKLPASRTNAAIVRLLGTELLTVRIDLDA
jgi:F420H(2)-dependent quinone reductase